MTDSLSPSRAIDQDGRVSRPDGAWVAIQRNKRSGAGRQYRAIKALIEELQRLGLRVRLYSCREELDAAVSREKMSATLVAVVAAGGDGTLMDVINRHPKLPVALLPLGTENLVARYLGIPRRDGAFVARMINDGAVRKFDLGRMGNRRFVVMASCGFDSAVQLRAHKTRKTHISRWHYWKPFWHVLATYDYPRFHVWVDESREPLTGNMVVIANLPEYALRLPIVPTADPEDGTLHVRVFRHQSAFQIFRDLSKVWTGRSETSPNVSRVTGRKIRIESERPLPIQADGDPAGTTPAEIVIEPAAATLFVPSQR